MHGFWWLIFPILGMGFGFFGMWIGYKRRAAEFSLLQTYVSQGKEPPAELLRVLQRDDCVRPGGQWRRVIVFGSLAIGFALASLFSEGRDFQHHAYGFMVPAIIFGCLSLGSLVCVLVSAKLDRK